MKVANKVINYSLYVRRDNKPRKVGETTSVQLPSIEFMTDSIKGAGVLGEVDFPSYFQPGSMSLEVSTRVSGDPEDVAQLMTAQDIEVRWVVDKLDTTNIKIGTSAHKAFIKCIPKKIDEGKLEPGSAQDGSYEYEVYAYKRVIDGKELLEIDKFNGIFKIGGIDYTKDIQAAL